MIFHAKKGFGLRKITMGCLKVKPDFRVKVENRYTMYELNTAKKQKRTPKRRTLSRCYGGVSLQAEQLEWKWIGVFVDKNIPHEYDDFVVKL